MSDEDGNKKNKRKKPDTDDSNDPERKEEFDKPFANNESSVGTRRGTAVVSISEHNDGDDALTTTTTTSEQYATTTGNLHNSKNHRMHHNDNTTKQQHHDDDGDKKNTTRLETLLDLVLASSCGSIVTSFLSIRDSLRFSSTSKSAQKSISLSMALGAIDRVKEIWWHGVEEIKWSRTERFAPDSNNYVLYYSEEEPHRSWTVSPIVPTIEQFKLRLRPPFVVPKRLHRAVAFLEKYYYFELERIEFRHWSHYTFNTYLISVAHGQNRSYLACEKRACGIGYSAGLFAGMLPTLFGEEEDESSESSSSDEEDT